MENASWPDVLDIEKHSAAQSRYGDHNADAFATTGFAARPFEEPRLRALRPAALLGTLRRISQQHGRAFQYPLFGDMFDPEDESLIADYVYDKLKQVCSHRKVFATETGFFGPAPEFCEPGDIAVVLYGLKFSAILRPVPDIPLGYRFCGVGCVHGVMDGSRAKDQQSLGREDEVFILE
ncbi:hypothetical protein MBLNU230_g6807t1 [Neophaeotheca triangularis]